MKRWGILIFFSVLFLGLITPTFADVAPRNPFRSPCPSGLKAYYCDYKTKDYREEISNECRAYENNPNFISHSFEKKFDNLGSYTIITITSQFCGSSELGTVSFLPIISSDLFWSRYARILLVTLFFELCIVIFFKIFRNKKVMLSYLFANLVSVLFLQLFVIVIPIASLLLVTVIGEILVLLLELIAVWFASRKQLRTIFIPVLLANAVSAVVGSIIYYTFLG